MLLTPLLVASSLKQLPGCAGFFDASILDVRAAHSSSAKRRTVIAPKSLACRVSGPGLTCPSGTEYLSVGCLNLLLPQAIDYFNEFGGGNVSKGGITVFSAGNDASDGQFYPAFYDGTVAVAGA
eukprot:1257168-Pleurochrysis_carterae.AAC.3